MTQSRHTRLPPNKERAKYISLRYRNTAAALLHWWGERTTYQINNTTQTERLADKHDTMRRADGAAGHKLLVCGSFKNHFGPISERNLLAGKNGSNGHRPCASDTIAMVRRRERQSERERNGRGRRKITHTKKAEKVYYNGHGRNSVADCWQKQWQFSGPMLLLGWKQSHLMARNANTDTKKNTKRT